MRAALFVSAVLHLAILAAALLRLTGAEGFSTEPVAALPVELVTIADETDVTEGEADAEAIVEDAAPETVEASEPVAPGQAPGATGTPADEIATDENAVADGAQSSAPEPEAAPPEPEPAAEPEPAQTDESAPAREPQDAPPREVAAADPVETASAAEAQQAPAPRVPETVVPPRRPPPPRRRADAPRESSDGFNADRLSQLINRTNPTGGGSGAADASVGAEGGRAAAALTLSEKDALRSQMQRCWNPPIGLAGADTLVVAVQIRLAPDGSVLTIDELDPRRGSPLDAAAADAARRAVLQCQPYRLPVSKYEAWKDVQVTFDPRDLF